MDSDEDGDVVVGSDLSPEFNRWLWHFGEACRTSTTSNLYTNPAGKMTTGLLSECSADRGHRTEVESYPTTLNHLISEDLESARVDDDDDNLSKSADITVSVVEAMGTEMSDSHFQAKCVALEATGDAAAEPGNLPDVVFSSNSSSGHSQPTSPDVLNGYFDKDMMATAETVCPAPVSKSGGLRSPSLESPSSETRNLKEHMRSNSYVTQESQFSGYATQGSQLSEMSSLQSFDDDNIFTPVERRENIWKLQKSSCSVEAPSSSSETRTMVGDVEKYVETIAESNVLMSSPPAAEMRFELRDFGNEEKDAETDRRVRGHWEHSVAESDALMSSKLAAELSFELRDYAVRTELNVLALSLIRAHHGISSIEEQLLGCLDDLSPPNATTSARTVGGKDDHDNLDETDLERILQMAVLCRRKDCDNLDCHSYQKLLVDVETNLRNHTHLHSIGIDRRILSYVAEHSAVCCRPRCLVPWCFFFNCCNYEYPDECVARLMSYYRSIDFGIEKMINPEDSEVEFLQFDAATRWQSVDDGRNVVPTAGLDFEVLAPAGEFGRICYHAQTVTIPPKLLFIEMSPAIDDLHVFKRLRHLNHPNVDVPLWVYGFCKRLVVCSEVMTYGAKSLNDVVVENEGGALPMKMTLSYMVGILSATEFLNQNRILYLLWIVDSIGLAMDNKTVCLRDFSCAVDESRLGEDELAEFVCYSLPPTIIPPEMFDNDIGQFSEIWGLGCILFHLTTGSSINRHLIHKDNDNARKEVQRFSAASCLDSLDDTTVVRSILSKVFVEKSRRLTIGQLAASLVAIGSR